MSDQKKENYQTSKFMKTIKVLRVLTMSFFIVGFTFSVGYSMIKYAINGSIGDPISDGLNETDNSTMLIVEYINNLTGLPEWTGWPILGIMLMIVVGPLLFIFAYNEDGENQVSEGVNK